MTLLRAQHETVMWRVYWFAEAKESREDAVTLLSDLEPLLEGAEPREIVDHLADRGLATWTSEGSFLVHPRQT